MNRRRFAKIASVSAAITAVGLAAFVAGRAFAGGIPATAALTYSGTLEDAAGAPLTGSHNIQVFFWNAATSGASVCNTTSSSIALDAGRFSVALPDACAAAVKASPNVWAEVLVDGASLGRTKIGAVPYAVEAGHATTADTATNATNATTAATATGASGALKTTLDGLAPATSVPKITPWVTFPANTFTATTGNGDITNQTSNGMWRRVGDSVELRIGTVFNGTPNAAGGIFINLPPSIKANLVNLDRSNVGTLVAFSGNSSQTCLANLNGAGTQLYGYCSAGQFSTTSPFNPLTEVAFNVTYSVLGWTTTGP